MISIYNYEINQTQGYAHVNVVLQFHPNPELSIFQNYEYHL